MKKSFKWLDDKLIELINNRIKNDFLDKLMPRFTNLGGVLFTTSLILLLILFGNEQIRFIGIQGATALAISQSITYGLKTLLSRERPYNILESLHTFGIILKDYSFPSGHTSASFSIATTISLTMPRLSIIALVIALGIGISRIYLGVHYPTDVVAGIIIGMTSAWVINTYLIIHIKTIIEMIKI